jgi:hypothetical protein
VIGIPFSLISEAKLVADQAAFRADLTGKKAHSRIYRGRQSRPVET